MSKNQYQYAKELARRVLLESGAHGLPVSVSHVCRRFGIDARIMILDAGNDGFCQMEDGIPYILVDPSRSIQRQRFTVAHEIGHVMSGHIGPFLWADTYEPTIAVQEREASIFAAELLMPECVLLHLGVSTAAEIQRICNVSYPAAFVQLKQMQKRYTQSVSMSVRERELCARFCLSSTNKR